MSQECPELANCGIVATLAPACATLAVGRNWEIVATFAPAYATLVLGPNWGVVATLPPAYAALGPGPNQGWGGGGRPPSSVCLCGGPAVGEPAFLARGGGAPVAPAPPTPRRPSPVKVTETHRGGRSGGSV